ncbi:unnamed protein product [Adineta steineri]|uniref:RETREG1-3/ARL6IP-like N-terminal reticulon-homology domain-containing protein n=2 Tax=Adineta steineri TaxID=433720 RepID=A0A813WT85_9BILA|nr:unnamed protein product [Adineta steineri]
MSSDANNSLETSNEFKSRTEELKESLDPWRHILLPINNLLEWKNNSYPFIIIGIITLLFMFIFQTNPPVLTLCSCIILIIVLIDLLVPIGIHFLFKDGNWTSSNDVEYTKLCEHIANFEQYIKYICEYAFKMREERPKMYLMVGSIFLTFIALCSQRIDNLSLCYLIALTVSLIPGICHRQLISLVRQHISNFWNNKIKIH